ncbi:MAG: adenylate/guanylate cyclase domain-containing protein [Verrucomicrobiae bacterium]|nr:adenylate/guanylate cyclase domain-containing protein [Verrucomicrobiae bacterium]
MNGPSAGGACPLGRTLDPVMRGALEAGMLRCERQRARVMVILLLALLGMVAFFRVAPSVLGGDAPARMRLIAMPLCLSLLAFAAYEAAVWRWLGRLATSGRSPSAAFRYGNAAIEVSYPTVMLFVLARHLGPIPVLNGSIMLLYFPFITLAALTLNWRLCAFAGTVAAGGFAIAVIRLIGTAEAVPGLPALTMPGPHLLKGVNMIIAGLVAGFVAGRLKSQMEQSLRTARERDRAIGIFGQHVSPQVAERLLNQPIELSGEERHVCVMFLDIRGFSGIAAERSATEVVGYLNTLFDPMITSVNGHRGIVNKFLGDGFMAVFGAPVEDPDLCRNAVRCAREILGLVDDLNARGEIPPTRIGIGLHAGPAVTGNVGSEQRKEYTIIGDTVNVAARVEQATKQFAASLLVTSAVMDALGESAAQDLGEVPLRGQPKPARLFMLA